MKLFLKLLSSCAIVTSMFAADISNLGGCVEDVRFNISLPETKLPLFTNNYTTLMTTLQSQSIRGSFPSLYQQTMLDPFINYLRRLGPANFQLIFSGGQLSPQNRFLKDFIPDVTEALLQNSEIATEKVTNAFQEMVSDLYDGYVSDSARVSSENGMKIKPPDRGTIPPLVKWGTPQAGPYTWTIGAAASLQLGAGVVSLPPNNRLGGLLAWATLPHETAGHDILHADTGLLDELGLLVYRAILTDLSNNVFLANYWRQCIDETASDIVGLLHGGPTTGIGLIGYFRGIMGGKLRSTGAMPPTDTHPIDLLRGYIAARVVAQMPFASAAEWAALIRQEVDKDAQQMYLIDRQTNQQYQLVQENAIRSAEIVADTIVNSKLATLEGHSLKEIQNWNEQDQSIAESLGLLMQSGSPLPENYRNSGYLAAHVVGGAITEALKAGANIGTLFTRMVDYLDMMHRYNQIWSNANPQIPPLPPAPPPPTPVPQDECACLCQCYQACKNQRSVTVQMPIPGTPIWYEMASGE